MHRMWLLVNAPLANRQSRALLIQLINASNNGSTWARGRARERWWRPPAVSALITVQSPVTYKCESVQTDLALTGSKFAAIWSNVENTRQSSGDCCYLLFLIKLETDKETQEEIELKSLGSDLIWNLHWVSHEIV